MKRTKLTSILPSEINQEQSTDSLLPKLCSFWAKLSNNEWSLSDVGLDCLKIFIKNLRPKHIYEAMKKAEKKFPGNEKENIDQRFKYFCGICWNIISKRKPSNIKTNNGGN